MEPEKIMSAPNRKFLVSQDDGGKDRKDKMVKKDKQEDSGDSSDDSNVTVVQNPKPKTSKVDSETFKNEPGAGTSTGGYTSGSRSHEW